MNPAINALLDTISDATIPRDEFRDRLNGLLTAAAADARRGAIEEAAGVLDARAKTCAKHGSNHPAGSADRREWAMAAGSLAAAEADIRNLPGAGTKETSNE